MLWLIIVAFIFCILGCLYLFKWQRYRRITSFRGRLLSQVNRARRRRKLRPLGRTKLLDHLAARHSKSMAKNRKCSHNGFHKRCSIIKDKTGLEYIGENCYMFPSRSYNRRVAGKLVHGWLNSPGHRANLLNPGFRRTGIGIRVQKHYIYATQLFTN